MADYDDIVAGEATDSGRAYTPPPAATTQNDYDSIVVDDVADKKSSLQASMFAASQRDPDKYADTLKIASQVGLPGNVVEGNEKLAQEKITQNSADYDKLISGSPKTAAWLSNPDNASVASDDITNVTQHENLIDAAHKANSIYDALTAGVENSVSGLFYRRALPDTAVGEDAPWYYKLAQAGGQLAGDVPFMAQGAGVGAGIGSLATPVGTVVGGIAGGWGYPAALRQIITDHLEKGDVDGASDFIQRSVDAAKAFGKNAALGLITEGVGNVATQVAAPIVGPLVSKAIGAAAETGTMTKAGAAMDGKDATAQDYLDNALFIGGMKLAHLAAGDRADVIQTNVEAQRADQNSEFVQNVAQAADDSNLRGRSPEKYTQMLGEFAQGTPAENVYIPVDAATQYFAGKNIDPEKVFEKLNAGDSYREAAQTGGDIKVPLENYINGLAGTEHVTGLANDIKLSPDDLTVNEVKAQANDVATKLKAIDADATQAASETPEVSATDSGVADEVQKQLMNAGYDRKISGTYAQIYDTTFKSLGERTGQDPLELWNQMKSKFSTGYEGEVSNPLRNADLPTFLNKTGDFFMGAMGHLAERDGAPQQIKDDHATILNWLGAKSKDDVTAKMKSKWASAFKSYLMEGEAPSDAIRSAFNRSKAWMLAIGRHSKLVDAELSPEVKGVMSRLMATDREIKAAETAQHQGPLFGRVGAYKMNDEQATRYYNAIDAAREHAETTLNKKIMADYARDKETSYQTTRRGVEAKNEEMIGRQRIYRTIDTLQKGELPDGTPIKLSKDGILDMWGKAGFDRIKDREGQYLYSREGGLHPDVAAELLGHESGDQMLQEIANAPEKKDLVQQLTDAYMDRHYPDRFDPERMPQEAIDAIHNDKRSQILRMELEHLATQNPAVLGGVIRRVVARVPSDDVVRAQATKLIADKKVGELSPYQYELSERKAAKAAGEALARGDVDGAFEAKQRELLSHELYRAASEAQDNIEKQIEKFKILARPDEAVAKSRDTDLVNAARAILADFGLGKKDRPAESYISKIKSYDTDTYNNISGLIESATENAGNYKEVSYDDFVAMSDAVNAIYDLSKTTREIQIEGQKIDIDKAKSALETRLAEVIGDRGARPGIEKKVTDIEKLGMKLLGAAGSFTRAEHWIGAVDGEMKGEAKNGPFRTYIYSPVQDGIDKFRLEKDARMKDLRKIFEGLKGKLTNQQFHSPELNYTFTKGEILGAILHSGNDSNFRKLLVGRGWGEANEDGSLNSSRFDAFISRMQKEGVLTKADYDFAQNVWHLFEGMKPDAQKAHKDMYGHYFDEITSRPFGTPYGEYEGGYVPAKIDMFTNEDQAIRLEREDFEKNNNSWQFPTTGRGFTKSRAEGYAAPLSLDLNMLAAHVDSVLRFTNVEPRAKEVGRLIMDKSFRSQLAGLNSEAAKEILVPWLQRSAQQKIVIPSKSGIGKLMDPFARFLRSSVAMQTLVLNPANTLHQLTGVFAAGTKVDANFLRNGLVNYITDHKNTVDTIMDKSDYMKSLKSTMNDDERGAIRDIIADPSKVQSAQNWIRDHAFFMQKAAHDITSSIVWSGSYEQAVTRGATEAEAVKEADSIIRTTQHINNPENVANYEAGTETAKLFTQFTGFYNQMANNNVANITAIARELGLRKGAGKMFSSYVMGFAMMAVSAQGILDLMYGRKKDDEDDDGYLNYALHLFFGSQVKLATAMIPYAGPALNSVMDHFAGGKHYSDDIRFSPVISALESAVKTPGEVYRSIEGEMTSNKRTVKDVLQLLGLASGLPIGAIGRPVGYLMDVKSGDAQPTGPIDFARGLATGSSKR